MRGVGGCGDGDRRSRAYVPMAARPPRPPLTVVGPDAGRRPTEHPLAAAWSDATRYDRRARLVRRQELTTTGTVQLTFRVVDGRPFTFDPGEMVGIEADTVDAGRRTGPYSILSAPGPDAVFDLLVREVPEAPLSRHLAGLRLGDAIAFRGPRGRSMVPRETGTSLVLVATGMGIAPLASLAHHLLSLGFRRRIDLFWGLRLLEDVCLTDALDRLARRHRNFSYGISLSRPPSGWTGLRGRVTESVPPFFSDLAGNHFYLAGNGAMVEEMATVLAELGVDPHLVDEQPLFNLRHRADPASVAGIRARFAVATARPSFLERFGA